MNTPLIFKYSFTCLATILAIAGGPGLLSAAETSAPEMKLIHLHAPNDATQTITVWLPKSRQRNDRDGSEENESAGRVINLEAPNNPTQTITIWSGASAKNMGKGKPNEHRSSGEISAARAKAAK